MKKFLIILLTFFVINSVALASHWAEVMNGTWVDFSSISKTVGNKKKITVKQLNANYQSLSSIQEVTYTKLREYCEKQAGSSKKECLDYIQKRENLAKNTYYSLRKFEIDCDTKILCVVSIDDYDKEDKLLKQNNVKDLEDSVKEVGCSHIESGSFGEKLFEYACKKK